MKSAHARPPLQEKAELKRQKEEAQPAPQQAAPPQHVIASGWEELEQPQDVQQQAGAQSAREAARPHYQNRGTPSRILYTREHACTPLPLLAAAAAACRLPPANTRALPARPCASAEPQEQQHGEPRKLSKLQKRRVKEDRERAIRELEMKKLEVRKSCRVQQARSPIEGLSVDCVLLDKGL